MVRCCWLDVLLILVLLAVVGHAKDSIDAYFRRYELAYSWAAENAPHLIHNLPEPETIRAAWYGSASLRRSKHHSIFAASHLQPKKIVSSSKHKDSIHLLLEMENSWSAKLHYVALVVSRDSFEVLKAREVDVPKLQANPGGFDTGAGEIETLVALFNQTVCNKSWDGLCSRGSVQVDDWLVTALAWQRALVKDLPLDQAAFLGTHNSFNDRADGYGVGDLLVESIVYRLDPKSAFIWAQQEYTMTDQLNMGIRAFHLDPHYLAGEIRLCHGGVQMAWFNDFIEIAEKLFNVTIDAGDQDIGCTPWARTLSAGLTEIADWLNAHPGEVIFIHWDDQGYTFNLTSEVEDIISQTIGPMVFAPPEKDAWYPYRWPTSQELAARNKSVVIQAQDRYGVYSGAWIFSPFLQPGWPVNCVMFFNEYPDCGNGSAPGKWSQFGSESQIIGPIYDGSKECGLFMPDNIDVFQSCGVVILEMDQVSPALMKSAVWTWAAGQPATPSDPTADCAVLNVTAGRWYTAACTSANVAACKLTPSAPTADTPMWTFAGSSAWNNVSCPQGYSFSPPLTGFENTLLLNSLATTNASVVWLGLKLSQFSSKE